MTLRGFIRNPENKAWIMQEIPNRREFMWITQTCKNRPNIHVRLHLVQLYWN